MVQATIKNMFALSLINPKKNNTENLLLTKCSSVFSFFNFWVEATFLSSWHEKKFRLTYPIVQTLVGNGQTNIFSIVAQIEVFDYQKCIQGKQISLVIIYSPLGFQVVYPKLLPAGIQACNILVHLIITLYAKFG